MNVEGGCYCKKVRYEAVGEPLLKAECLCRPCQYFSGGAPNLFMVMPPQGFRYTSGAPRPFKRDDLEKAVTREFCGDCGTHLTTLRPDLPFVILKVGTLDDPSQFEAAQMAIFAKDRQAFHCLPEGLPTFEGMPPR